MVYGGNQDNYGVDLDHTEIFNLLHSSASENLLVRLDIDGAKEQGKLALIQAVQHHPLNSSINHVDFHCVGEDEEIVASVPLQLIGESVGVKAGGLLDQQLMALEVRCKPADLPEKVEGDISDVNVGEPFHVGSIAWPDGVSPVLADNVVVAVVAEIRAARAEAAEEAEAAAAPAEGEPAESAAS